MKVSNRVSDAAAVSFLVIVLGVAVVSFPSRVEAGVILPRVERSATNDSIQICPGLTPCGWAIYTPFTRKIDYYVKNTCRCPENLSCVKTSDDVSVSAYVYQCLPGE